ncbi:MAG: lysophospholipid acyltransferase family protein, partial [Armatimonadetes bacterium]|nr:lysophospholipid acyltransferase family protein [Candidatus Hippobium faecium]
MGDSAGKKFLDKIGAAFFNHCYARTKKLSFDQIERRAKIYSDIYCRLDKKRINFAACNMKAAFGGEYTDCEIGKMIKEVVFNFIVEFYMFFNLGNKPREEVLKMVEFEGKENLDKAMAENNGVIFLTAHFGNWEMLARRLCAENLKISVIARDSDHVGITDITNDIRNSGGYSVYSKDRPLLGIIKALRRKECVGILPDQSNEDGIWVDFFGRPAKTAAGPAIFSLKTGAPIVPVFCVREAMGKYKLIAYPKISFDKTDNYDEDVKNLTQKCNDVIEAEIRKYPTSWLWIHNRWKSYS